MRNITRRMGLAISMIISTNGMLTGSVRACPEVNRLAETYSNGQLSMFGPAVPDGALAADDYFLPPGNGTNYSIRRIRFIMISSFVLAPGRVTFAVYSSTSAPNRKPNAVLAVAPPSTPPTVRDLGAFDASFRVYEVTYSIPAGFISLSPNQWYWLMPYGTDSLMTNGLAFAAVNDGPVVTGEVAQKTTGIPGGGFNPWTPLDACCIGSHDLAIYVDGVQTGQSIVDLDCNLTITVNDLFSFLAAWFAGSPTADINGVNGVTTQDIFDFLALWFAGL